MARNLRGFQIFEKVSENSSAEGSIRERYKSDSDYKGEQEGLTGYWHDQRLYLLTLHELALE